MHLKASLFLVLFYVRRCTVAVLSKNVEYLIKSEIFFIAGSIDLEPGCVEGAKRVHQTSAVCEY